MPYRLQHDEPLGTGLRRIAREQADRALESLEGAGEIAPRVHDARKRFKKIRAVLRLLRSTLGTDRFDAENDDYRSLGHLLGPYREGAVRVESLQAVFAEEGAHLEPATWVAVHDLLEEKRPKLPSASSEEGPVTEAARRLREARARMDDWPLPGHDDFDAIQKDLRRIYRKGRTRLRRAEKKRSAGAHHDWRKRVKDLWYHERILREVWPEVFRAMRDETKRLSDSLGDAHDLADLTESLTRGAAPAVRHEEFVRLLELLDARRMMFESASRRLGARIYAEKSKHFVRRMRLYWEAWRAEPPGAAEDD